MDEDATGAVWFGCQYEGAASQLPPLVGKARPGGGSSLAVPSYWQPNQTAPVASSSM